MCKCNFQYLLTQWGPALSQPYWGFVGSCWHYKDMHTLSFGVFAKNKWCSLREWQSLHIEVLGVVVVAWITQCTTQRLVVSDSYVLPSLFSLLGRGTKKVSSKHLSRYRCNRCVTASSKKVHLVCISYTPKRFHKTAGFQGLGMKTGSVATVWDMRFNRGPMDRGMR